MKRSLAPPRRDKPTGGDGKNPPKPMPAKQPEDKPNPADKSPNPQFELDHQSGVSSQKFQQRYRNKNLNVLPTQMLVALSGLTTLDISYNKLTDSQIQLIMNSCVKLSTFCMQGNMTNLIPASISKLKLLVNFRHDWVKLNPEDMYEPEKRLERMKDIGKKPEFMIKLNRIQGLDFIGYVQVLLELPFDQRLLEKIEKCQCSTYAKQNMLKLFEEASKGNIRKLPSIKQASQKITPHKNDRSLSKPKQSPNFKRQTMNQMDSRQILSETAQSATKILDMNLNDISVVGQEVAVYYVPGFPLHNLFATFDKNHYAPAEIDGLLLKGYNPNQYDVNGLSPYHVCILQRQKRGIQYLLEISSNNPGFFDLQMPSIKQGRNILHFSVSLRNYTFTKMLVDFGLPVDKRDAAGYRLVHLSEQNIQSLILLRKLLRKRTNMARNPQGLSIPPIPHQNKRNYVKHPQRQKQQSRFRITYSRNDKLLQLFEAAAGIPNCRV